MWGVTSTTWVANTMRTRGVDAAFLQSGGGVSVSDRREAIELRPDGTPRAAGLVFLCGAGVDAKAYLPLLRPVAEAGHVTVVIKLPYRLALLERHREDAMARAREAMASRPQVGRWIVAGHSLGAALAARLALSDSSRLSGLVLVGTTHPRDHDLSALEMPVTKIYGTRDGVAPPDAVRANARLLPAATRWVEIDGGNHSQFGHYGHQLFDGTATISREDQQAAVRRELLESLARIPSGELPASQ